MFEKNKLKVHMRARLLRAGNIEKLKKLDDSVYETLARIDDDYEFISCVKIATANYRSSTEVQMAIHIFLACSSVVDSSNTRVIEILTDDDFIDANVVQIIADDISYYRSGRALLLSDIYYFIKNNKQSSLAYKEKCVRLILKIYSNSDYKQVQEIIEILSNPILIKENLAFPSAELIVKKPLVSHYAKHLIKSNIAIKSGTARRGLELLSQVEDAQTVSSICNVLTNKNTIEAGVAIEGANIISTCSKLNALYAEKVLIDSTALASGKAKEGALIISRASSIFNISNIYDALINDKLIKYGLSLDGAKIISKAVSAYSSDKIEYLFRKVNNLNLPYILEVTQIISNTFEDYKVDAMCAIFLSPITSKAGNVIEGVNLISNAPNERNANLISLALQDKTLDEQKLSMDVAQVVSGHFTKENLDKVKDALEDDKVKSKLDKELVKELEFIILKEKLKELLALFGYTTSAVVLADVIAVREIYSILSSLLGTQAVNELVNIATSESETIKRATITVHLNKVSPRRLVK